MVAISKDLESSYLLIFREAEKYIPIMSIWWITFIFKEYISEDGNEVLYCIDSHDKVKVFEILIICLLYIIHISILFLVYSIFWDNVFLNF